MTHTLRTGAHDDAVRLDLPDGMVVARSRFDADLVEAAVDAGMRFLPRSEARIGSIEGTTRLVHLGRERGDRTVPANEDLAATGLGGTCLPTGSAPRTWVALGSRVGTACLLVLLRPWLSHATCELMALLPGPTGRAFDLLNAPPPLLETS